MPSAPPVTTATNPSSGEYIGAATSGVGRLGNAAASTNVSGNMTQLSGQASLLQTGGATAMDPQKQKEYDALLKSVSTTTKPWTTKLTAANTKITTLTVDRDELQAKVDAGETLSRADQNKLDTLNKNIATQQATIADLQPKLDAQNGRLTDFMATNIADAPKMTELLNQSFPELAATLAASQPFLDQMGKLGPQGEALMGALKAGFQGTDITWNNAQAVGSAATQLGAAPTATAAQAQFVQGPQAALGQAAQAAIVQGPQVSQAALSTAPIRDVTTSAIQAGQVGPQQQIQAQQIKAAQMGPIAAVKGPAGYTPQQVQAIQAQRVADIGAQQIGQGALGSQLMGEAQRRVSLNGQLSPEATRDAIQSARQGFAARGMATGNAALGAELLNRDRYSRQRSMEDLQFAQGVQGADITRQQANQDAALRASAANQGTAAQLSLANQSAGMNAQQLNQAAGARATEFTQGGQLQAGLANAQTAYNVGQTNAQLANQGALAFADNDLRAQAANQGTTLSAGTAQAQLGTQASIASAGNNLTAGQSNQSADLSVFGQGNNMNQFNAGQTNQMGLATYQGDINQNQYNTGQTNQFGMMNTGNQQASILAGYQGGINQGQFNAGQTNQVGLANLGLAGQYGLTQGQLTQQNNQFNSGQTTQNNQFNSTGQYNASGAQAGNLRANNAQNINNLQGAYALGQNVIQGGLTAAGIQGTLAGAANMNNMMMGMYGSGQPVGSQSIAGAVGLANTWGTNQMTTSGFNANAQNWSNGQQWAMNNMPSSGGGGMGGAIGGLGGMALGAGVGALLAAPTGGMSIPMGMAVGAGIGGGVGGAAGNLIWR